MKNNNDFITIFENRLCEYTGAPFAAVVDCCTNAILLSLEYQRNREQRIKIPANTYVSVPMTLINYGYNVWLHPSEWVGSYRLGSTNVFDYAVGFEKDMYKPGEVQCVSFQQKKRLAIGKGGAILLDDPVMYEQLKRMRHDGRDSSLSVEADGVNMIIGYHMNMTPDNAARGLLLLNQLSENYTLGSHKDYPDISKLNCLKDYK